MVSTMPNILGGGDSWVTNPDGTTQIRTIASSDAGATSIVFTNVPVNDEFGFEVWLDMHGHTPSIKQTGDLVFSAADASGHCTCTMPCTAIVAAQAGATLKLRIIR